MLEKYVTSMLRGAGHRWITNCVLLCACNTHAFLHHETLTTSLFTCASSCRLPRIRLNRRWALWGGRLLTSGQVDMSTTARQPPVRGFIYFHLSPPLLWRRSSTIAPHLRVPGLEEEEDGMKAQHAGANHPRSFLRCLNTVREPVSRTLKASKERSRPYLAQKSPSGFRQTQKAIPSA
ncbi:uncharacterized protein LY79DRAFT_701050 [Colletotrichum navitas]|uniref:Uncharacterized protein n=1 Tax=Colletotrichum navitas TaxID=681940 RepID=A0AAD8V762_9PEZI|nr:uncharacterized protein LY79DRAFT_701050 [Colletotrichum navitas]KAK1596807.1 hypothetical protein LY79DRAFT_701050 [Colletotrichum navitas]